MALHPEVLPTSCTPAHLQRAPTLSATDKTCPETFWARSAMTRPLTNMTVHRVAKTDCYNQWHRSVVQHGGSRSVRLSHQTVSGASKISFTFHFSIFDTSLSSLMMWNLQSYPTTVLNERMSHFWGENILWPLLHIFRGQDPTTRIYAPGYNWSAKISALMQLPLFLVTTKLYKVGNKVP